MARKSRFLILFLIPALTWPGIAGADVPILTSEVLQCPSVPPLSPEKLSNHNPYLGHKRRCAAFARYALYLLTGLRFPTYGSAHRWSRHARLRKADVPLWLLEPGDLLFFMTARRRVNHVAIILEVESLLPGVLVLKFQDERGVHFWFQPSRETYLGMTACYGARPSRLETVDS